jgi:creatinine amidohydrolase
MGDGVDPVVSWYDLGSEDIGRRTDRWVLVPAAQIEGHGPFLPVGTDKYIVDYVASGAATRAGALVGPAILTGNCFDFERWPGFVTAGNATYIGLVQDYVGSLVRQGFSRAVFLLNHAGHNFNAVDLALSELRLGAEVDFRLTRTSSLAESMSMVWTERRASPELSAMMALRPDLVDWEAFRADSASETAPPRGSCMYYGAGNRLPNPLLRGVPVGVPGSSAELGRQFLDTCILSLTALLAVQTPA